jgi:hypothetical protein
MNFYGLPLEDMGPLAWARIAAYALNRLTREVGLANLAIHWNGDDLEQVLAPEPGRVMMLDNTREVASVSITERGDDILVTLIVSDCHDLIRQEHLSIFYPQEHGIQHTRARDPVTGDKRADLVVTNWILENPLIDMGPRQSPIKETKRGKLKVTSFSGKVSYH